MTMQAKLSNTADRLLSKYGTRCTLTKITGSAYDPATGENTESTAAYIAYAYVYPVANEDLVDTSILRSDRKFLMSVIGSAYPYPNDRITVNGETLTVIKSADVPLTGRSVIYKGFVRL